MVNSLFGKQFSMFEHLQYLFQTFFKNELSRYFLKFPEKLYFRSGRVLLLQNGCLSLISGSTWMVVQWYTAKEELQLN